MPKIVSSTAMPDRPTQELFSCGGVVFREDGKVLLIKREDENRWCLPKGGIEEGEEPQEAALREIREETGLQCKVLDQLCEVQYQYFWPLDGVNYDKRVRYFLVEVLGGSVKLERGFVQHKWCTRKEALMLLYFDNDKRVVIEAFKRMKGHGPTKPKTSSA